jgi:hypothetical protein
MKEEREMYKIAVKKGRRIETGRGIFSVVYRQFSRLNPRKLVTIRTLRNIYAFNCS